MINKLFKRFKPDIFDYKRYWNERYNKKGTSGDGSYGPLAFFKAAVINDFIQKHNIARVVEFGCGDGNNLSLYRIDQYLGFDVSSKSIELNINRFKNDASKSFFLYDPQYFSNNGFLKADLVLCLDVLYHIVNDADYFKTMTDIFSVSDNYVILYTSIDAYKDEPYMPGGHVKHRKTMSDLQRYDDFSVIDIIQNKYPDKSSAVFIILRKKVPCHNNGS